MNEVVQQLAETVRAAAANCTPLCIRGGGSKDFYGNAPRGEALSTRAYGGIVAYEPTELVITARCGTPLADIEAALRERRQMLAFEPPQFGAAGEKTATLGGCIAAGLSGPRRASAGAVRDFVLGVRLLNGNGEDLRFGGQVMKNVAGYDVSRLIAGSLGTLGVILEASLKVLPLPAAETTLRLAMDPARAIRTMNEWAGKPLPISATCHHDEVLSVRLSGAEAAVRAARAAIGGEEVESGAQFWSDLREQRLGFFRAAPRLWRLSVRSTTPPLDLPGRQLIEWGGSLRWLDSDADAGTLRAAAGASGGHATLFRAADKSAGAFQPLPPALMQLHHGLKRAFDPAGILNPGRMYQEL